ncbi:MAG: hypothetical protein WCG95_06900 [bacterium]
MNEQAQILEAIRSEIDELENELKDAKIEYADMELESNDWHCRTDRKVKCKVIEGKIEVLWKMKRHVQGIFTQTLARV